MFLSLLISNQLSINILAACVGMEIPKTEKFSKINSASKDINNKAADIFYEQLTHDFGKNTIKYLKDRGISGETAKFFKLGYSNIKSPSLYEKFPGLQKLLTFRQQIQYLHHIWI